VPKAGDVLERTKRVDEAEYRIKDIIKHWSPATMDRNFFLNVERDFMVCLEALRKRWRLSDSNRQVHYAGGSNLSGDFRR